MDSDGHPPGVVGLLVQLDEAGAVPVRHGAFVGCLHPDRVPAAVWAEVDRHEAALRRQLRDSPTPFHRGQRRTGW